MTNANELADFEHHTAAIFAERWRNHDRVVLRETLQCMVDGQAIDARTVSAKSSIPESNVSAAFATDRYDLNNSGGVVDVFGVSTTEQRPFVLTTRGFALNICCALVSMMMSQLTSRQNTIHSEDSISGRPVGVTAGPEGASAGSDAIVVVLVAPPVEEFCEDPWNSFCKFTRMYESAETASSGTMDAPPAIQVSVSELFRIAQSVSARLWN